MNEINISIESKEIKSEIRPIKAKWSREMTLDLNMLHGLDLENELIKEMRRENRKKSIKNIFRDEHN
jgi:hypothetical protein